MAHVYRGSGRFKQSIAHSSYDAWTRFYKQDENSPNAIVSYYTKGALAALGLDLLIQQRTDGQHSLDDVMRYMWQHYGKHYYRGQPKGIGEEDRKSTRLNSSHVASSYAVFCLKKKRKRHKYVSCD